MSRIRRFLWGQSPYTHQEYLREMLYLILTENSSHFCGSNYLQTKGKAMGTKMALAFANALMARIEKQILSQNCIKPLFGKSIFKMSFGYGPQI